MIYTPKIRNRVKSMNMAIRSVYNNYRVFKFGDEKYIIPNSLDDIKSRPLFDTSYFKYYGEGVDYLENTIVDSSSLNEALKSRYDESLIIKSGYFLRSKEGSFKVSEKMDESRIQSSYQMPSIGKIQSVQKSDFMVSYRLSAETTQKLISYKVIEMRVFELDDRLPLILAKEIFPMIKKASEIKIYLYITERRDIFKIIIESKAEDWTFYSMHHVLL